MKVIAVIPARMASSRFPGKPLAKICGIPMIGHVYHRSKMSKALEEVYIATCDEQIRAYAESIGAKCIMTDDTHERATDRTAQALLTIEQDIGCMVDIVVMAQGDEPMLHPTMIDQAIAPMLQDPTINVVNLMSPLKSRQEHENPNIPKVVVDRAGYALYFSREPIPSWKKGAKDVPMLKQVCIIPFRRNFLLTFNTLAPTPLEAVESVDMLRAMEHGYKVKMVMTSIEAYSVDTPEDLLNVSQKMQADSLTLRYLGGVRS